MKGIVERTVEFSMKNKQIVYLFVIMLMLFGVYSLFVMPKQEFPVFTIRQGLVVGVYPGVSSSEIEKRLTKPLEEYLFSYKEVKKNKTYSISRDGLAIIVVDLADNVKNKDEFWSKFRHGLKEFKQTLPSGVVTLIANNDFGETSALLISIESEEKTYRELEYYLEDLENRLRQIKSVSNLRHYGLQHEQISVYIDKEKLAAYGINSSSLLATLFTQGVSSISGTVKNEHVLAPIHISETFKNEKDVAEQIVYIDPTGNMIRLKDIATIVREYPTPTSYIENQGNKCLLLSLEMQEGHNIVRYGKEVNKVLDKFQKELPDDVHLFKVADQPEVVNISVKNFLREMIIAICTVLLVLMLLQPLRVASIAAMTIPITIFISIGVIYALGFELNTVTLAALIVVLGIIVDDSVVIIDNYLEKLDHGIPRWEASVTSAKELFKSVLSATLAISITFYPFLFTTVGIFNDFVQAFPWTITITLFISLLIAVLFVPIIQYTLIKTGLHEKVKNKKQISSILSDGIQKEYNKIIHFAFKHSRFTIAIALGALLTGVVVFFNLPQKMMPITERNQFAVEIYLPTGTPLTVTAEVADSLRNMLNKDKRITSITSFIGTSSPRFHTCYAPNLPGENYAQFIVSTTDIQSTIDVLDDYAATYVNYFPNALVRFKQLDFVFASYPIELRIRGNNLHDLILAKNKLLKEIKSMKEILFVHSDYGELQPGVLVNIDNVEANNLGISKVDVSNNLALRFNSGIPITSIWEDDYSIDVVLKAENDKQPNFTDIPNEYISTVVGNTVPLRQIATTSADFNPGQIVRRNGVYCLSLLAEVKREYNVVNVTSKIASNINDRVQLPKSVTIDWGGVREQDKMLMPMIIYGLIIAVAIIFMILVFHFRKINLALLILSASLLSVFGGSVGILIMRMEYSLTSVLGLVALMGIIVRNGIIMYDYAEELRLMHGRTAYDAALEAGKRRMRPIFLTSAAASMGVIPMIISKSALWAPMGVVICFGTWLSMLFVVTVLPVTYWLVFKKTDKKITL
ncbi:MAG TPA: efflux RND transporter permease subunit [Bacteroidales bacterium]|nr:efflux RND transporter permease subunit [Bacteroidales bacterium]HOR82312.1 efflux RND transporter permease subunit [Bacteroidales bacterium]HPJ91917.1 efflux RND transporter permease subunit [Bacteroidales bacterium]